jgi:Icc-related predicted phosphoesterase
VNANSLLNRILMQDTSGDMSESAGHLNVRITVPVDVPALRLLCVSDTHDLHQDMPHDLPTADILVHAGDFTCQGRRDELQNFQSWIGRLLDEGVVKHAVVVAGNHERSLELSAKHPAVRSAQLAMKEELASRPSVTYLEDSACLLEGVRFYGSPWTTCTGESTWAFQKPDSSLSSIFSATPSDIHVLVTHQPPLGIGDHGGDARRCGSASLLQAVEAAQPLLHVFGHIHAGHGVYRSHATTFVNAAVCDDDYKPVQKPVLVEFVHSGVGDAPEST